MYSARSSNHSEDVLPRIGSERAGARPIIGHSSSLRHVLKQVEIVAPTDATVLVLGETGTGKELVARAIHDASGRSRRPFVKLNCAAIPSTLLESELFGHERGAFTGAVAQRIGRFELADGGTLFLDEVGEIPLELQPKLLRVLQEHEFERVGGAHTLKADVRVIAATNRDLPEMVGAQRFRDDLYYRLNVFPITIPPLRERPDDIEALVEHFVEHFAPRMNRRIDVIPLETLDALRRHPWPGNVRELENVIQRAVILSTGDCLTLPPIRVEPVPQSSPEEAETLEDAQRAFIARALDEANWVIAGPRGAAVRLGIKRTTLHSMLKRLGLSRPRAGGGPEVDGRGHWPEPGQMPDESLAVG
jgi:formate hydrogenlyase transcriptional activator